MDLFYTRAPDLAQLKVTFTSPAMRDLLGKIDAAQASFIGGAERLTRLRLALTENLQNSYYRELSAEEVKAAVDLIDAIVPPPAAKKKVVRAKKPVELDFSGIEQSDLFADPSRWPRKPYCTHDLSAGLCIRSLRHALLHPYIQANPPYMRVWALFDIDRPGAANAWEKAGLPPPAWTAVNRENGHAHSAWGLSAPVLVDGRGARDGPMRYLCAVEAMMREALEADSGFGGLITKNPAHAQWMTLRGPRMSYELAELAEYLPGIEKFRLKRGLATQVGLGRNVTLFETLRKWSYKAVRRHWGGGLDGWNAWISETNSRALVFNSDFRTPLDGTEVWHLAKSVAKWTWKNFSQEEFSAWQARSGAIAGRASGVARRQASEENRASARLMAINGHSSRQIATELGVDQSTVVRWLRGDARTHIR